MNIYAVSGAGARAVPAAGVLGAQADTSRDHKARKSKISVDGGISSSREMTKPKKTWKETDD